MTVAELGVRMSWPELVHWIALLQLEAELALPPEKRPKRPKSNEEAAAMLNAALGISPQRK